MPRTKPYPESTYRGCRIIPQHYEGGVYFGVGLDGVDEDGHATHYVRVIFPDETWILCANPDEAHRHIDSNRGLASHMA